MGSEAIKCSEELQLQCYERDWGGVEGVQGWA